MNKATKIWTINDIMSIDFYLAYTYQKENDGISFELDAENFWSKSLSFSSQSARW